MSGEHSKAGNEDDAHPPADRRARLLVSSVIVAAVWLAAAYRWIATDSVVPWDSKNQFYAFFRFLASAIHSGSSAFWNPYHYGGHPSVADPQSLIFAPFFLLWAWFDPAPSLRAFDLLVYAHLLLGGLAVAALGVRARWPVAACVLAAALFIFGGGAAGRLQHTGIILSYSLFPPALLLLQLVLQRRSLAMALGFSVLAAALALGRNQVALLLCFLLAAVAVGEVVAAAQPGRYLRERLAMVLMMAVVITALAAAPMLLNKGEYPRVEIVGMGGPWQNLAVVRGWEATNGYNPLRIGFYDRLVSPGESNWRTGVRDFPASFVGYDGSLARALGLRYLVLGRPIEEMPGLAKRPVADVLLAGPKVWIYRLQQHLPRLTFTRRVEIADADGTNQAGQLLASPSADRVLIDDDTPPALSYAVVATQASAGQARIVSRQPGRIEIDVEAAHDGMLAMHGIYYPGWVAEIDTRAVPILRADVLFRAIEVPPGSHHVVFHFAPFSLKNLRDALHTALHGLPPGGALGLQIRHHEAAGQGAGRVE
jgi:hypothetical protein